MGNATHAGRRGLALLLCAVALARGETPAEPESAVERLAQLRHAAERYRITLDTEPQRTLALKPGPVLRWTNPLRRTHDGAVFVWLSEGRPEVIASFYRHGRDGALREDHEFQSLATTALRASRDGQDVWFPPGPGVAMTPIPGAPVPASAPAERLRQMHALARQFKARFDGAEDQSELRLLSKPLYRYDVHRAALVDGALFAFVQTTDPEVLFLIEARSGSQGLAWHFGLARMSMVNLKVEHKDRVVWRAGWVDDLEAPNKPYVTLLGVSPAALPESGAP